MDVPGRRILAIPSAWVKFALMINDKQKIWPLVGSVLAMLALECSALERVRVSEDGSGFVRGEPPSPFIVWGVNYDHTEDGKLLEDYWDEEWSRLEADFREIRELGANVVRIHLQLGQWMASENEPRPENLQRLRRLLGLCEDLELYLDITGLNCFRLDDVPAWYEVLEEQARWEVQARFWEALAETCKDSPAVFCYDLMNEPILAAPKEGERWLTGELGGYHFVQRLTLDLAGRTQKEVAEAWTSKMTRAIRKHDPDHLITVGVIPWAHVFPKAKPLFYSPEVARHLDFVSVHFYPNAGEVDAALTALKAYEIGKPLVIEEMFPLKCSIDELIQFVEGSREMADGWISFYWGKTVQEYNAEENDLASALKAKWFTRFQKEAARFKEGETVDSPSPER